MIVRNIQAETQEMANHFRALCIVGPRQSGKTTLAQNCFGKLPYVSLEHPPTLAKAQADPEAFLLQYKQGAILDEVQRMPEIFSYLQGILDTSSKRGQFILTGSNNFLLHEQVSQSLAGRVGYLELLPLSFAELQQAKLSSPQPFKHILQGGYPEIWNEGLNTFKWMNSYVQTYVQRDVRLLRNITNLGAFNRFILMCANYTGQLINKDAIANAIGVDNKTIMAWLAVLESSYIIYLLHPWYNNLNKRIIKSPKLYFYDTGLLCFLLGINSQTELQKHKQYGAIFENWVLTEIRKNRMNAGLSGGMHFFRDSAGNEVDLILEKQGNVIPVEVKAAKKTDAGMLAGLKYWQKNNRGAQGILVNGGEKFETINEGIEIMPWYQVSEI